MNGKDTEAATIKDLVQRFRVCWKVWPEVIYIQHKERKIGYQLELAGTHEPGGKHPEPACEHCQRVFQGLRQIAEWTFPREERSCRYEIGPFDQSIRYWSVHGRRPDVVLTVEIIHRHAFERPLDACQDRCLKEMEDRLTQIGACRLSWTDHAKEGQLVTGGGRPLARPGLPIR